MAVDPGDWTINSKLAELDPALAHLLEIQHFKPILPDAVAQNEMSKAVLDTYFAAIVSLATAAKSMQTVANVSGNFGQTVGGLGASA
jgi:hypothetical protein